MSETKKPISLKWKLTLVIVGLWVLPIILIIWIYGQYITTNIQANNERTILNSVSTAVKICKNRMESSIVASRNASYNTTIKDAYAEYKLSNNKVDLYTKVNDFLKQQYKYDDKFNMAVIYFTDGSQDIYYSMANHAKYASTISSFKEEALFEVKKFANTIGTQIGFININDRLYMVRNMFDSNYERFAVLTLEVNKEMMFESFESVVWCNGVTVQINDTWFTVIGDEIIIAPDSWAGYYTEPQLQKEKNGTYVCGTEYESSYTLSYAVKVDTNAMSNEFTTFLTMMFTIILLLVPMFIGLVLMFQNNILKPVTELVKTSAKIEKGLFGAKTRGEFTSWEFSYLAENFNRMSDTLLNQFDRLYKEEIALRDARIMALQSQINPHFLNNTLEIINWEARLAGNDRVSSMIESLSVMMDAAADRSHTPMIPLEEEFKYVNAYLHIIQKRLGKRLTVIKEIDESLYSYKVPRLILQPILENAIEHGVDKCDKGTVIIRAYKNDDDNGLFFLEVENDGLFTRRDEDRIKTILAPNYEPPKGKKGSLGIRNVNQRLKIIYGEKGGLYITMTSKGGALAKIVMTIEQTKQ